MCGTPKKKWAQKSRQIVTNTASDIIAWGKKTAEKVFWSCCPFRNPWLSFLFISVCASNSSANDLLPIALHILIGNDLFQKRYRHQKEILAEKGQIKTRWKTNTSYPRASMAVICCPIVALLRKSGNTSSSFSLCKPTTNRSFIFHGNAFWSRPVKEGQNK